jgi:protein-S-isoprenylcysteine O-methyltransferase Ste14
MSVKEILIFIVGVGTLAWASRRSLGQPRSHGFPRFFAWVLILALCVPAWRLWFTEPLAPAQLASWFFLTLSLVYAAPAILRFARGGRQDRSRDDAPMFAFEKTTVLITDGLYSRIRHPMYGGLVFLAIGIFLKAPSLITGILLAAATVCLLVTMRMEEEENIRYFGDAYRAYMRRTAMFLPVKRVRKR